MNPQIRPTRRVPRLAAVGAGLALVGGGAWMQLGAEADPISSDVPTTCSIATGSFDVTVPLVVDDTIDPVVEGGQELLVLDTGLPELPVEATINRLMVTVPIPSQIASVNTVTFSGGNMTGSWAVSGTDLVLTFTGPQPSSAMDLPTVTTDQTVATGIAPTTISWTTFSRIDADTNFGTATCIPKDAGQVVNTTQVEAADGEPTPTTEPGDPTDPTEPTPTTVPGEPTPPTEPGPTEPPVGDDPGVSVGVEVEVGLPGLPTVPGAPVPGPGAPGGPAVPGVPSLPAAPPVLPAPTVPTLPAPALPPIPTPTVPAPPAAPAPAPPAVPTLPAPALPPAPVPPAPPVVPLPPLPGLPDLELDAEVGIEVGFGL